jgi:branched-chain amino acid transport system permease protein
MLFAGALRASAFGRCMIALRDDELAGGTAGVPVVRMKVLAFVIASALAGLSGSLFVHYANYTAPQDFDLVHSIVLLVMLIVGGEASVAGAIIGAILLSFLPELLRFLGQGYLAFFGAGVLLCLIVMPQGVAGLLGQMRGRRHA